MGTKSRESIYGSSIRASAQRAKDARKEADRLACVAWNRRMLGFRGPAQPSPALGDALNAGFSYLEVRCLGCDTHQTVALNVIRRPKTTPIHELERYTLQGLFGGSRLSVQAQPSRRSPAEQDFSQRSPVDLVAWRAMIQTAELLRLAAIVAVAIATAVSSVRAQELAGLSFPSPNHPFSFESLGQEQVQSIPPGHPR
jgi:hypothetical protein